jgi:hypothetical protein
MTMGRSTICVGVFAGVAWLASGDVVHADKKLTVCHRPPGNAGSPQTISIGESAAAAHLGHGDQMGQCPTGCQGNGSLCDDGDACTSDTCLANGQCGHAPVNCDDGNACTTDLCQQATGCLNVPAQGPCPASCDDGNACTSADTCTDGQCKGTAVAGCCTADVNCDDGNPCTVDTCAGNACLNEPRNCSVADKCVAGFCDPASGACATAPVSCDDNNVCTDDLCDSATGCFSMPTTNPPEPQEASCSDGADNDCDGAIDSADTDCDSCDNPGAAVCTDADAANFKTGLESSLEAALPVAICLARGEMRGGGLTVETCYTRSGGACFSDNGCTVNISYDDVAVGPSSPAGIPFDFTLRTQFDVTITMPVRYDFLGIRGTCTLTIHAADLANESTGVGEPVDGACSLGPRLTTTTINPGTIDSLTGCSDLADFGVLGSLLESTLNTVAGTFHINHLIPAVSSYAPQCPVQP